MAFASKTTIRVDLPHEPGEWFELRLLSFEKRRQIIAEAKRIGGDDGVEVNAAAVRLLGEYRIVGWSYKDKDGTPIPVTPEAIADLDEDTSNWLMEGNNNSPLLST